MFSEFLQSAFYAIVIIGGIIGGIITYRNSKNSVVSETNKDAIDSLTSLTGSLKEQNELQAQQIEAGKQESLAQAREIIELKATVSNIKDIPLEKIEKHMETTNQILQQLITNSGKVIVNNAPTI